MGNFLVRYTSRVVIYNRWAVIRLATGLPPETCQLFYLFGESIQLLDVGNIFMFFRFQSSAQTFHLNPVLGQIQQNNYYLQFVPRKAS